jgi:hypothetical protein
MVFECHVPNSDPRMRRFKAEPVPVKPVTKPFFEVSDDDFIKPLVMMPKK